jgi:hypothetical protein
VGLLFATGSVPNCVPQSKIRGFLQYELLGRRGGRDCRVGYVQRGVFNKVLVILLRGISDLHLHNDLFFAEDTATLSYGGVRFAVRAHKSYVSLELDIGEGEEIIARKVVELLERSIHRALKVLNMNMWNCALLLEHENCPDHFLSLKHIRSYSLTPISLFISQ